MEENKIICIDCDEEIPGCLPDEGINGLGVCLKCIVKDHKKEVQRIEDIIKSREGK